MTARDNESTNVVEMDAIDIDEWDRDRHTPRAHDTNLAELVRQSTAAEAKPNATSRDFIIGQVLL